MNKSTILILPLFIIMLIAGQQSAAQQSPYFLKSYPDTLNTKRLRWVLCTQGAVYASTLSLLYFAWYSDYPMGKFHWFNDNGEWMQMDKIGHATTSAYFGKFGYEFYRYTGMSRKKAIWYGGSAGFMLLTVIEILDGFSSEWGASAGDLIANTAGAGLFIGQQLLWDEQRFNLKWSYHNTEFSKYRPDLLGSNGLESMLKDYNGQTYWLSGNIKSFFANRDARFPGWLNVAFGYGATGMLGAYNNPAEHNGKPLPEYERMRQFYLSLDVDLTRIKTKSRALKAVFNIFGFLKIPFPAVEFNKNGVLFHPFYF